MGCVNSEIDYFRVETNVDITATGFNTTEIGRLTVPAVPYPVYLEFDLNVVTVSGAAGHVEVIIHPADIGNPVLSALNGTGWFNLETQATMDEGRKLVATARLPADSAGDYVVGGVTLTGVNRVRATQLLPAQGWAVRR